MEQILPFLLFLGTGLLLRRLPIFPVNTDRSLNLYVIFRLLITPCLFILACRLSGLHGEAVQVSLFETAMPSMVTAGALASIAALKPGPGIIHGGFWTSFFLCHPAVYFSMDSIKGAENHSADKIQLQKSNA
jgi:predicted permease